MGNPFYMGDEERANLAELRKLALQNPVNIHNVNELIKTEDGFNQHMEQMHKLSVKIPVGYTVTFSIETGQKIGPCRHMSMSSSTKGSVPIPEILCMVAKELGFAVNNIFDIGEIYFEDLGDGREAVNIIQPIGICPEQKA